MYRVPRVLHWLEAGQWLWIRTLDYRANTRGCGFEWLFAPLVLFSHGFRLIFLPNLVSFLLLPGLVFSAFRRLGVGRRASWWWMWLVPAGLCYCLQAGSDASDAYAAVYVLASVYFALRAKERSRPSDVLLSLLASALVTAAKQTSVPLALPGLLAAALSARLLLRACLATALLTPLAVGASGLPLLVLNARHGFTWVGTPRTPLQWDVWAWQTDLKSPFWGLVGNAFNLTLHHLAPPFFFLHEKWNSLMDAFVASTAGAPFRTFEGFGKLESYPDEQVSGLGLPLFLLLVLSITWALRHRDRLGPRPALAKSRLPVLISQWLLLLLVMAKVGAYEVARMLAPYYVLLIPGLLHLIGSEALTRLRWWRSGAYAVMLAAAAWIAFLPSRPLWGASLVVGSALRAFPHSILLKRAARFYPINPGAKGQLAFATELPPELTTVGYATDIRDLEPTLWKPFRRRVERVLPSDTPGELTRRGISYIVVDEFFLGLAGWTLEQASEHFGADFLDQHEIPMGADRPPRHLYLLKVRSQRPIATTSFAQRKPVFCRPVSTEVFIRALGR